HSEGSAHHPDVRCAERAWEEEVGMNRFAILLCILMACAAAAPTAGKRGLSAEDYIAIETPGDPRISPDGKTVAYTVSTIDGKQNRRHSAIWVVPLDGSREP